MATWTPATFQVREYKGEMTLDASYWSDREGFVRGIWGLHRGAWGPFGQWDWLVTHLPTGLLIQGFQRKRDAQWFVRQIEHHRGWDAMTAAEGIRGNEELKSLAWNALDELDRRETKRAIRSLTEYDDVDVAV